MKPSSDARPRFCLRYVLLLPIGLAGACAVLLAGTYLQQRLLQRRPRMEPPPREVTSPEDLSPGLRNQRIFWQRGNEEVVLYLDGRVDERLSEVMNDERLRIHPNFSISPSGHYVAYTRPFSIVLWDLETNQERVLATGEVSILL